MTRRRTTAVAINLALQGGGSHGAFTWGVLDALLADERVEFAGVSGTSAGALNAAVLACGYSAGGRDGARRALAAFWTDVGGCRGAFSPLATLPSAGPLQAFSLDANPFVAWFQAASRWLSPYQSNPLGLNALRNVVRRHVSDEALRATAFPLYVTATRVRSGEPRVFDRHDLSVDALLASACLPQVFQAVQIEGEPYWDGGFVANPALWPLYETGSLDIVLVQLDPLLREGTPTTPAEINDRLNEISFNANLVAEMRAIRFVQKLVERGTLRAGGHYKALRMHRIADDDALAPLDAGSKLNSDPRLLAQLHRLGVAAGERWLADHWAAVGRRSSFDIDSVFLAPRTAPGGASRA